MVSSKIPSGHFSVDEVEIPTDPWLEADMVLTRGARGDSDGEHAAYLAAIAILGLGRALAIHDLPADQRVKLTALARAAVRVLYDEPDDWAGRLRAMKRSLLIACKWRPTIGGQLPDTEAVRRIQRAAFGDLCGTRTIKPHLVDDAIEAMTRPMSSSEKWRRLHALAKALGCGSKTNKSFSEAFSRVQL